MKLPSTRKLELTAIMLCTLMLCVAVSGLFREREAVPAATEEEPFPELYAPAGEPLSLDRSAKIVYLTFDDGPSPNTERLLEILAERGAKATFFVTAQQWEEEYITMMYSRILEEGHVIGLHTYTHNFEQIYASPDAYLSDLDRLRELLESSVGYQTSIFRFPGGSNSINATQYVRETLQAEMARRGYQWYDWDIATGDDTLNLRAPEDIAQTIIDGVRARDGATIILCHDNNTPATTPDGVAMAIDALMAEGYQFHALPAREVTTVFAD